MKSLGIVTIFIASFIGGFAFACNSPQRTEADQVENWDSVPAYAIDTAEIDGSVSTDSLSTDSAVFSSIDSTEAGV